MSSFLREMYAITHDMFPYAAEADCKVPGSQSTHGVTLQTVNYDDKESLLEALQGVHTVLSFIQPMADPGNTVQKNLIDAAIIASVKRSAPSQWGRYAGEYMARYERGSNDP